MNTKPNTIKSELLFVHEIRNIFYISEITVSLNTYLCITVSNWQRNKKLLTFYYINFFITLVSMVIIGNITLVT